MPELGLLGEEVLSILIIGIDLKGASFNVLKAELIETLDLTWVIGEKLYTLDLKISKNLSGHGVVTQIHGKAQMKIASAVSMPLSCS